MCIVTNAMEQAEMIVLAAMVQEEMNACYVLEEGGFSAPTVLVKEEKDALRVVEQEGIRGMIQVVPIALVEDIETVMIVMEAGIRSATCAGDVVIKTVFPVMVVGTMIVTNVMVMGNYL